MDNEIYANANAGIRVKILDAALFDDAMTETAGSVQISGNEVTVPEFGWMDEGIIVEQKALALMGDASAVQSVFVGISCNTVVTLEGAWILDGIVVERCASAPDVGCWMCSSDAVAKICGNLCIEDNTVCASIASDLVRNCHGIVVWESVFADKDGTAAVCSDIAISGNSLNLMGGYIVGIGVYKDAFACDEATAEICGDLCIASNYVHIENFQVDSRQPEFGSSHVVVESWVDSHGGSTAMISGDVSILDNTLGTGIAESDSVMVWFTSLASEES